MVLFLLQCSSLVRLLPEAEEMFQCTELPFPAIKRHSKVAVVVLLANFRINIVGIGDSAVNTFLSSELMNVVDLFLSIASTSAATTI